MTAVEHIIAWIESSREHYDRLLSLSREPRKPELNAGIAYTAFSLARDAYREMTRGGDAWASDHSAATILDAAKALLEWELEQ